MNERMLSPIAFRTPPLLIWLPLLSVTSPQLRRQSRGAPKACQLNSCLYIERDTQQDHLPQHCHLWQQKQRQERSTHLVSKRAKLLKGLLLLLAGRGGPPPAAEAAGAAFCRAGTALKMGWSVAIGKSDSSTVASWDCPRRRPCTISLASSAPTNKPLTKHEY